MAQAADWETGDAIVNVPAQAPASQPAPLPEQPVSSAPLGPPTVQPEWEQGDILVAAGAMPKVAPPSPQPVEPAVPVDPNPTVARDRATETFKLAKDSGMPLEQADQYTFLMRNTKDAETANRTALKQITPPEGVELMTAAQKDEWQKEQDEKKAANPEGAVTPAAKVMVVPDAVLAKKNPIITFMYAHNEVVRQAIDADPTVLANVTHAAPPDPRVEDVAKKLIALRDELGKANADWSKTQTGPDASRWEKIKAGAYKFKAYGDTAAKMNADFMSQLGAGPNGMADFDPLGIGGFKKVRAAQSAYAENRDLVEQWKNSDNLSEAVIGRMLEPTLDLQKQAAVPPGISGIISAFNTATFNLGPQGIGKTLIGMSLMPGQIGAPDTWGMKPDEQTPGPVGSLMRLTDLLPKQIVAPEVTPEQKVAAEAGAYAGMFVPPMSSIFNIGYKAVQKGLTKIAGEKFAARTGEWMLEHPAISRAVIAPLVKIPELKAGELTVALSQVAAQAGVNGQDPYEASKAALQEWFQISPTTALYAMAFGLKEGVSEIPADKVMAEMRQRAVKDLGLENVSRADLEAAYNVDVKEHIVAMTGDMKSQMRAAYEQPLPPRTEITSEAQLRQLAREAPDADAFVWEVGTRPGLANKIVMGEEHKSAMRELATIWKQEHPQPVETPMEVYGVSKAAGMQLDGREVVPNSDLKVDQTYQKALTELQADPQAGYSLVARAQEGKAQWTPENVALLTQHRVTLENLYDTWANRLIEARKSDDIAGATAAEVRLTEIEADRARVDDILPSVREMWGLTGRVMQKIVDHTHTLLSMRRQKIIDNGGEPLTAEQSQQVEEAHSKITAAEEGEAKQQRTDTQNILQRTIDQDVAALLRKQMPDAAAEGFGSRNRLVTREEGQAAISRVKDFLTGNPTFTGEDGMHAGLPVPKDFFNDLVKAGVYYIEGGVREITKWKERMKGEFGPNVEPLLTDVFDQARGMYLDLQKEKILARMGRRLPDQGPEAVRRAVQQLRRAYVAAGNRNPANIVDMIHDDVKQIVADMTREEIAAATAEQAQFRQRTKGETKSEAVKLAAERKQADRLAAKEAARKPQERPSKKEETLNTKVSAARAERGFTPMEADAQMRYGVEGVRRRLDAQIDDLGEAVDSGRYDEKRVKALERLQTAYEKQRDSLTRDQTETQRLNAALRISKKNLEDARDELQNPGVVTLGKPALEARVRALTDEVALLQDSADFRSSPTQRAQRAYLANLSRRQADWEQRLATGDFSPRAKNKTPETPQIVLKKFEVEKAKVAWTKARMEDQRARRPRIMKALSTTFEVPNFIRSVMTSFDLSASLRQGGMFMLSHPVKTVKTLVETLPSLFSEKAGYRITHEIMNDSNYRLARRSGLYLAEHGVSLSQMEERYMSRWSEKVPVIRGFNRQYATFLNKLRMDMFDTMVNKMTRRGTVSMAEAQSIANFVNAASGRGTIQKFERTLVAMNGIFFAPRYQLSRFQMAIGQPLWAAKGGARRAIAVEYARILTGLSLVYAVSKLMGAQIGDDPRSSDFGKIIFADGVRIDPLMGIGQITVFATRELGGATKTPGGVVNALRGPDVPYNGRTTVSVGQDFLRMKLAPVPAGIVDVLAGSDVMHQPVSLQSKFWDMATPITVSDVKDIMTDEMGVPEKTALSMLLVLGTNIQNYNRVEPEADKTEPLLPTWTSNGGQ
jgi:hypothetical protein